MKVSAEKFTDIIDTIYIRWRVGPKQLADFIGYSRQTIHTWKKVGCHEEEYTKLENFLLKGPGTLVNQLPQGVHSSFSLSINIDFNDPVAKNMDQIANAIAHLEALKKILIKE